QSRRSIGQVPMARRQVCAKRTRERRLDRFNAAGRFSIACLRTTMTTRIDVHHHILPRVYVQAVGEASLGALGSSGRMPDWSIEGSLAVMDGAGIRTAITS